MAGALRGITIEIGGDSTKLGQALRGVQNQSNSLQRELKSVNQLLKMDPSNATAIAQKYTLLGKSIATSKEKLDSLKEAQRQIDSGEVQATEEQYRDLEREIGFVEAKIERLQKQQAQFASVSAVQMQAIGKEWQEQGQKISDFGQKLMPVTIAIAAVGAASTIAAIQFESSFAGVRKTVDATEQEFKELEAAAREAAKQSPTDVNTINHIMELGGQLGIATNNLSSFANVVSDLDVATDLNVEDASTSIAQFANITNMAQGDTDRFGSTLVALGNTSATTESAIMEMAMRVAGAGSQVGMTQAEILGFSAALSSVGINAEAGGSAISTVISEIDKEVALNGETLQTWADLAGMSVDEFRNAWETDAAGALQSIVAGMGDASRGGENLNLILEELGITQLRQSDMMKRLSNASGVMASSLNTASNAWSENVALTNEASQRYATTESQLLIMKNRIYDAGISIGKGLQPALLNVLQAITPVVEGVGDLAMKFEEADPVTQRTVTTIGLMAAGFAPLMIVTGKMTSGLGTLVTGLGKASAAMAANAAATTIDTAAQTANDAATKKGIISAGLKEMKDNLAAIAAAKKAAATTADTVATAANDAATKKGVVSTIAHTVATAAQTTATTIATTAQVAWNAAMAANPIGTVIIAVGALVAAIALLSSALNDAVDDTNEETAASQELKATMEDAQATYDAAVEKHGEESEAALKAKAALDEATVAYSENKQTIEQFCISVDKAVESHEQLMDSVSQTTDAAQSSAGAVLKLSDDLASLASVENKSAEDKARLQAVVDGLNASCANLGLTYDATTDSINMNVDAVQALAAAEADRIRGEAAQENYNQLIEQEVELTEKQVQAKEDLLAQGIEVEGMTRSEVEAMHQQIDAGGHAYMVTSDLTEAQKELIDAYYSSSEALEENKQSQAEAIQTMTDTINKQSALKKAVQDVEAGTMTAAEAAEYYTEATGQKITADEIAEAQAAALAEAELKKAQATSEATEALQTYIAKDARFGEILKANGYSVDEFAQKLTAAGYEVDDLTDKIEEHASKTANAFDKIEYESDISVNSMLETLQHNTEATNNWSENIVTLYGRAGSESERQFIQYLSSLGVEYAPIVQELVNGTDGKLAELAAAWQKGGDAAKIAALAEMGLLKEGMITETGELTEEAERILEANAPELGDAGAAGGVAYTEELKNAIAKCPTEVQAYIQQLENTLAAHGISIGNQGAAAGNKYSSSLGSAIASCPAEVQAYIAQLEGMLADYGISIEAIGGTTGTGYGSNMASGISGQSGSVSTSAAGLQSAAQSGTSGMPKLGGTTGTGFGSAMSSGIGGTFTGVYGAAGRLASGAAGATSGMGKTGSQAGSQLGSRMASGINGQYGGVYGAAGNLASGAQNAKNYGDPYQWGYHLGSNFASGISATLSVVSGAAAGLASKVKSLLGHTVPEEGPLSVGGKGEALWGEHLVENFAGGIVAAIPMAERSVSSLASKVRDGMDIDLQPKVSPNLLGIESGIRSTFGVDIDQASLEAIRLNAANNEKKLDAVVATLEAMSSKLNPNYKVVLDTGVVAGAMTNDIDRNLATIQKRRAKGL